MNGNIGIFASARVAAGSSITATFQQATVDPSNLSSYTFASQAIGTASATRRVVVALTTASSLTVSSATIGGISATIDATTTLSGTARLAIISAVVPTGTTASVVVNLSGSAAYMGIGLWTLDNGSPSGGTAADTVTPITLTTTTVSGGVVIAVTHNTGVSVSAFTWTNATGRWTLDTESGTETFSGADGPATGTSTAVSVAATGGTLVGLSAAYA
ncbi:MAG TPA: hypothetical protein VFL67_10440 [Mycobacterium sp.]|nr:hypothetical protein [Mycobacterium sp.]